MVRIQLAVHISESLPLESSDFHSDTRTCVHLNAGHRISKQAMHSNHPQTTASPVQKGGMMRNLKALLDGDRVGSAEMICSPTKAKSFEAVADATLSP